MCGPLFHCYQLVATNSSRQRRWPCSLYDQAQVLRGQKGVAAGHISYLARVSGADKRSLGCCFQELLYSARNGEAACSSSSSQDASDNMPEIGQAPGPSAYKRQTTDAGPPAWVRPDLMYKLEFDGASRGNPGPAGAGAALSESTGGSQVGSVCLNLGIMTNNQAEYYGLLAGLEACKAVGVKRLSVLGDSQLVVKQVQGLYKVNNTALQELHCRVKRVVESFQEFHIRHVLR
ncbi:hypothetical protein ABBQ38_15531 [Trebouxia sp. C0009 RCD-2024]